MYVISPAGVCVRVRMCVCVYVCASIPAFVFACVCLFGACMYVCMCVCASMHLCVRAALCMFLGASVHSCMHACVCVCVCAYACAFHPRPPGQIPSGCEAWGRGTAARSCPR